MLTVQLITIRFTYITYLIFVTIPSKTSINFSPQPSLWSNSHIHKWLLKKPSVEFTHSVVSDSLRPHESQHARPPCPSPTPGIHSDSHPSLLPGKSHGRRSLESCSPWGRWGSDTTEWLHFHFSLSCIEERNGNPLQCYCLENPKDGGALWAAVSGVAQSQTRLKRLSSSD